MKRLGAERLKALTQWATRNADEPATGWCPTCQDGDGQLARLDEAGQMWSGSCPDCPAGQERATRIQAEKDSRRNRRKILAVRDAIESDLP